MAWPLLNIRRMRSECVMEVESDPVPIKSEVRLPMGMMGFERVKDYVLIVNPGEEPFEWLQAKGNPGLNFVVINPFLVVPEYQPDIPESDAAFLGLTSPADALLLNVVTVRGADYATVNLKGPIVINRRTRIGKQVILANANDYSVEHAVAVEEVAA